MHISNKSFKELIINHSLNTGSVEVMSSSLIRSTNKAHSYRCVPYFMPICLKQSITVYLRPYRLPLLHVYLLY